jgi:type VI protein secretion system component Hcp
MEETMRKPSTDTLLKKNRNKGTSQDPKISRELSDSELNKATGGADRIDHGEFQITKYIDKASS